MKTSHYFSKVSDFPTQPKEINIKLKKISFEIYTSAGIFSKSKLDKGTEVLINNCVVKDKWKILDLGCGYGVVGIAIKKLYPETEIMMTDVSKRAIKLARMNVKHHNLKIKLKQGDLYEKIDEKFNTIIANPPQTAGKEVCFNIIRGAKEHLKDKGLLQMVIRPRKGGKHLSEFMEEIFGNVEVIAKKSGYSVYVSKNG